MQRPHVVLGLPDGTEVTVAPGGILGRMATAAVRINDPRVSEAQALVTLRGRRLKLFALRGLFSGPRGPAAELDLCPGTAVELVRGLRLEIREVFLPGQVLALTGLGPAPIPLEASVHSLVASPELHLVWRYMPDAAAYLWDDAEGWWFRAGSEAPKPASAGSRWEVSGHPIGLIEIALDAAAIQTTALVDRLEPPLRLVVRQETVHIQRQELPVVVISGTSARIVSELVAFAAPTPWDWVAKGVWGQGIDPASLRRRWDRNLHSLRARLCEIGVRRELIRSDGHGNVELVLGPEDVLIEEG